MTEEFVQLLTRFVLDDVVSYSGVKQILCQRITNYPTFRDSPLKRNIGDTSLHCLREANGKAGVKFCSHATFSHSGSVRRQTFTALGNKSGLKLRPSKNSSFSPGFTTVSVNNCQLHDPNPSRIILGENHERVYVVGGSRSVYKTSFVAFSQSLFSYAPGASSTLWWACGADDADKFKFVRKSDWHMIS